MPICGNGVLDPAEACDDSNTAGGDGCAGDCTTIAPGWACPVSGRRCVPICGDGLMVGPETCDDRNLTPGDGCSDVCVVEPSTTRCGDGIISGAEECDEGAANSDASQSRCTTSCRFGAFCGNSVIDVGEECDNGNRYNNVTYGNQDGCAAGCKYPHFCGDAIVDRDYGEQCDLWADQRHALLVLLAGLQAPALTTSATRRDPGPARRAPPVLDATRPDRFRRRRPPLLLSRGHSRGPARREQPVVRPPAVVGP